MENFIYKLKKLNIDIDVVDDQLKLDIPEGIIADDLLEEIRQNKQELVSFIKKMRQSNDYKVIQPAKKKEYYTLSSAQKRLFFLYEFDKTSQSYNMPQVVKLEGDLDKDKIGIAFNKLIDRHEILRTNFVIVDEMPVQKISEHIKFNVDYHRSTESEFQDIINGFIKPFDIGNDQLIRAALIELSTKEYILVVDMHHIISDGVSQGLLINEFMALYNDQQLPELSLHYKDYAEWQQSDEQQQIIAKQKDFWLKQYAEETNTLLLPTDYERPKVKSFTGGSMDFIIDIDETRKLKLIAEREQTTPFMAIMSVFCILLSKICNEEDIVIGTPIAGRQHSDLESMIGMFVSTLPLRNQPKGEFTFREFLGQVRSTTLESFDNQNYPYEELIDELKVERDMSRNPLFDVMIAYQNFERSMLEIPKLKLTPFNTGHVPALFDLTLTAFDREDRIYLNFDYARELFKEETIQKFVSYYKRIVSIVADNANIRIADISIISEKEKDQLLNDFNSSKIDFEKSGNVIDAFEARVGKFNTNVAIKHPNGNLTYAELDKTSNKIARYLQKEHGVKKGDLIGIMLDRDQLLLPVIFGIMKAGGAYVPIDVHNPKERINAIIEDSQLQYLITKGSYLGFESEMEGVIDLDKVTDNILKQIEDSLDTKIKEDDLAYVIYTSGSTGVPKGVMISHKSLMNIIHAMQNKYPLLEQDSFLLKTTYSFDVSVAEIFGWFMEGGSLTVLEPGVEGNPIKLLSTIENNGITHVNFVPSMFSKLVDEFEINGTSKLSSLKYIFLAGEALPKELVNRFQKLNTGISLSNIYGPTEATIYSCGYDIEKDFSRKQVPIGKPLANIELYILDKRNKILPIGVPGELCISGTALALGYLNNEKLTKEKFIDNPFGKGCKMYKSGDLVKWLPDGNIEYLGRIDNQVKIRGFRIELGEIESVLAQHKEVKEAIAIVDTRIEDKRIIAFVTSNNSSDSADLKDYLGGMLPAYMVPSLIVIVDEMPLTPNGKINRKALLGSVDEKLMLSENYVAPTTELEIAICDLWKQVLNIEKIGINDSFFDIGGNSLSAITLSNKMYRTFNVEFSLQEFFVKPTIKKMSEFIEIHSWLNKKTDAENVKRTEVTI